MYVIYWFKLIYITLVATYKFHNHTHPITSPRLRRLMCWLSRSILTNRWLLSHHQRSLLCWPRALLKRRCAVVAWATALKVMKRVAFTVLKQSIWIEERCLEIEVLSQILFEVKNVKCANLLWHCSIVVSENMIDHRYKKYWEILFDKWSSWIP